MKTDHILISMVALIATIFIEDLMGKFILFMVSLLWIFGYIISLKLEERIIINEYKISKLKFEILLKKLDQIKRKIK